MEDLKKRLLKIEERLNYLIQLKEGNAWGNLSALTEKLDHFKKAFYDYTDDELIEEIRKVEDSVAFLEERFQEHLSPMERKMLKEILKMIKGLQDRLSFEFIGAINT